MTRKPAKKPDYSLIYPGIYKAPPITQSLVGKLRKSGVQKTKAFLNVMDENEFVKVELFAPGMRREDIVVNINQSRLTISGVHRNQPFGIGVGPLTTREFDYCFNKSITLPKNVDTDFYSAEYKDGVLKMMFPKMYHECECSRHSVVVY